MFDYQTWDYFMSRWQTIRINVTRQDVEKLRRINRMWHPLRTEEEDFRFRPANTKVPAEAAE